MHSRILFPNYMAMRQRIAPPVWHAIRLFSVGATLGLCAILFVRPQEGLTLFWRMVIPFLPLLFFLAPGLWRNICPLAAMNQTPRVYGFTRGWTLPNWMKEYGYVISVGLFLILVMNRRVLFNHSGPALSILILANLLSAFAMGALFKGKSGWCSSICPLLPVQRIYGQTPFATVPNSHCQPCVGCTKNCYDFNPATAYLADMYDEDKRFAAYRKIFVGLFPGFILAFYTIPEPPAVSIWTMYGLFGLFSLVSLGFFFLFETFAKVSANKVTVLFGALALNTYYWFNVPVVIAVLTGSQHLGLIWGLRVAVFELTLFWIYRTWRKEKYFVREFITLEERRDALQDSLILNPASPKSASAGTTAASNSAPASGVPLVRIEPEGVEIEAKANRTLLEVIESQNLPIEVGCRMGVCGADPICVREGMENLSPVGSDERGTLERLGLGPNTRMACMARVRGACTIGLKAEEPEMFQSSIITGYKYDRAVQKVVIVGNGIAGVTAADHVRRRHPHCEIHLIGRERHHLYNRMGITRLIYGRSAMQGLYLMPEKWYDDVGITCWLNTRVTGIDAAAQQVQLGTGDAIDYDRLILTTGSESFVPPIENVELPGSFVLRTAEDAMAIREYVQTQSAKQAVVAGGGLLGLEAAYGLHKLGMQVTVLERSTALLTRQLDARGGEHLRATLAEMGIEILTEAESASLQSSASERAASGQRVRQVTLRDGRTLPCDLFITCAGIRSNVELARAAGLNIKNGVLVDAQMRTSDPHIFAAGDVVEFNDKILGLWAVAVSQAEVAAAGAVSPNGVAEERYTEIVPVTMLKVVGVDLTSIGQIRTQSAEDCEIFQEEEVAHRYRKLVVNSGKVIGAILMGYPEEAPGVAEAAKQKLDIARHLPAIQAGDWSNFQENA